MSAEILINGEKLFKIESKVCTIGRSPDCDIYLRIPSLSRFHATIVVNESGEYIICDGDTATDKPSLNGTEINGKPLKSEHGQILKHGDEIRLSPLVLIKFFEIKTMEVENDGTIL
ncbi:MAG: FHA domain-containing protein [Coleofasciculaceae cyanobacterium]